MGLYDAPNFSLYHHVLNRARWSALELSRRLLLLLVRTFAVVGGALTFVIDETLERRWGRRITKRGHYRDPLASSKQRSVATSGLRWIVLDIGHHSSLDAAIVGVAGVECPRPHAGGQSSIGPAA